MGGIGKTQLAVEFAYRYGTYFRGVHWLNLADPSQLEAEIARCGREMRLPNYPEDQPTQVTLTLHTWKSDGPRLLILDNFEEPARANDVLRLLGHSSLRLLITSRRTDWLATSGLKPLPLEVFTPQESLDFLRNALDKRKDADPDLANLAERLGHLPLALELASRYLNGHPRLSLDDYLTQSREALDHPSMHGWRADLPAPTEHDLDLQRTFALSWMQVKDEIAQKIFLMAGYLAPNTPIPLEIFEKALEITSETCDEAFSTLYGLGLLKEGETDLPAVHPLLAHYARKIDVGDTILGNLSDTMASICYALNNSLLPRTMAPFLPHLFSNIQYLESDDVQEVKATLWTNLGFHQNQIANYQGAIKSFQDAIDISESVLGSEHELTALRVSNLGIVLKDLGDLAGAKAAYERVLKIDETTLGPDHPSVARDINNLGTVLQDLGDLTGARGAYERALKIAEKQLGKDHPNVASGVNNLGLVLKALSDQAGAKAAFERAIKIWETNLGSEHPQVAIGVNNLGGVLQDMGDLAGAKAAFGRAIKIWETNLGSEHPQIAVGVNNLGMVLKALGDLTGAKAAFERALVIFNKFLPPDHPNIKTVQENLDSLEN